MRDMINRKYPDAIPGESMFIDTLDDPNFNDDDYGVFGEQSGYCYFWGGIAECNEWLHGDGKNGQ